MVVTLMILLVFGIFIFIGVKMIIKEVNICLMVKNFHLRYQEQNKIKIIIFLIRCEFQLHLVHKTPKDKFAVLGFLFTVSVNIV
jgi:hypothetical protein